MRPRSLSCALAFAVAVASCGDDGSNTPIDGGRTDGAVVDAADIDAPDIDARAIDARAIDAPIDAMPTDSELIGFARTAADGTGLSLPIVGATVTYIKPLVGSDPAGFTIQVTQAGPAMFIAVDPATTTPVLSKGDVVSFTINTLVTVSGQKRATVISGITRTATATDVTLLTKNITAATDVVSAIDSYDSELVDVTATVAANFISAGNSFESAAINTTGLTGNTNFLVRVPSTLKNSLDFANGCTFTLNDTPVGRFVAQTQLAAFTAADITVTSCPAPTVVSAVALTATTVQVTFSRNILASSVLANGSQFTFNGLTASAAAVVGRNVTVTTDAQVSSTSYTVTVANTVTDLQGTALAAPLTAMFSGFAPPAVVRINEVNANIASGCDLIELRVVSGGSMTGYKLFERTGNVSASNPEMNLTFGALQVQTNELVVVHLASGNGTCNPGTSVNETALAGQPVATFARNYDTAYDVFSTDAGLVATDNVITLYNPANVILDAVLVDDDVAPTVAMPSNVAAASEAQAAALVTATQWQMNGGGVPPAGPNNVPPAGFIDETFRAHAVLDSDSMATVAHTGGNSESLRRIDNTDDNEKADWAQGANTWGTLNAGQ